MKVKQGLILSLCLAMLIALSSCASREPMKMKIHTEPEGSHIVYRIAKDDVYEDAPWIYLGITPYEGLSLMDSSSFDDNDTITFKVMRHGYLDQTKKWTGAQFMEEYEQAGRLFWTPRLVKASN